MQDSPILRDPNSDAIHHIPTCVGPAVRDVLVPSALTAQPASNGTQAYRWPLRRASDNGQGRRVHHCQDWAWIRDGGASALLRHLDVSGGAGLERHGYRRAVGRFFFLGCVTETNPPHVHILESNVATEARCGPHALPTYGFALRRAHTGVPRSHGRRQRLLFVPSVLNRFNDDRSFSPTAFQFPCLSAAPDAGANRIARMAPKTDRGDAGRTP